MENPAPAAHGISSIPRWQHGRTVPHGSLRVLWVRTFSGALMFSEGQNINFYLFSCSNWCELFKPELYSRS